MGHTLTTWRPVLKTASTILGRLGIPAAARPFPEALEASLPTQLPTFFPIPATLTEGETLVLFLCQKAERGTGKSSFQGSVCCRKDGEWGDTTRRRSPGRLFLSQPERASLGVKVSRLTHHAWGGVAPQDLRPLAFLAGRPGSPSWPTWPGAG